MVIILVMISLLGAAFIVHTFRMLRLNKQQEAPNQRYEKIFAFIGGVLLLVGAVGLLILYFSGN